MALIRVRVDPPSLVKPPHGLLDVAQVVEDTSSHWRTGVEYDTYNCHESKVWGEWCTGAGEPRPVTITRTITLTFSGSRAASGDPDDFTYSIAAQAAVDGGPTRQIRVNIDTGTDDHIAVITTGAAATTVVDGVDDPVRGAATVTDVLSGVTINVPVRQNDDGTLEAPTEPIVIAVPEPGIPDDCFGITTVFTAGAAASGGGADVQVTSTTTSAIARRLVVYVGGTRTVVETGAAGVTAAANLATGFYRVSVRDLRSDSFVSGWLYIAPDFSGSVTLIQPTCPVKEITSAPWQTLDADPFTVYAEVICKSVAFPEASASALEALDASQHRAVERYYWDTLVERAQPVQAGEPIPVVRAVAALEQYIASVYNGIGTIHVSPWGIEYLAHANLLDSSRWRGRYGNAQSGEALRTWRGTPVVVGHGYPREATDVPATGDDFWMFVTGQIVVRHSQAGVVEVFNQHTNDKSAVAERTFVVIDDCPIPGVVHVNPQQVI